MSENRRGGYFFFTHFDYILPGLSYDSDKSQLANRSLPFLVYTFKVLILVLENRRLTIKPVTASQRTTEFILYLADQLHYSLLSLSIL